MLLHSVLAAPTRPRTGGAGPRVREQLLRRVGAQTLRVPTLALVCSYNRTNNSGKRSPNSVEPDESSGRLVSGARIAWKQTNHQ